MQDIEIIITGDGSSSLLNTFLNETYHSRHGAIQESIHVFINQGLKYFLNESQVDKIKILEVGFGTGLNCLLTLEHILNTKKEIHYTTLEAYPLDQSIWTQLNYSEGLTERQNYFNNIHNVAWETDQIITSNFSLKKQKGRIQEIDLPSNYYHIIYFDAFAPNKQPEMWNLDLLTKIARSLTDNGVFVTYCAKGQLKRDLRSLNLSVETLPGPPGKMEMIRALKN